MIRHPLEADVGAPLAAVFQQRHESAITLLLKFAAYQAGKVLLVGEILATNLDRRFSKHAAASGYAASSTFLDDLQVTIMQYVA
jgi:hypothetical protein